MKAFSLLTSIFACFAATISSPAFRQVDWDAVITVWFDMRGDFSHSAQDILAIVLSENEAAGNIVKTKIETAAIVASSLFGQLAERIGEEVLTEDEAKYHIGALRGLIETMEEELQEEILLLTPVTAEKIRNIFIENFNSLKLRSQELYALLRESTNINLDT